MRYVGAPGSEERKKFIAVCGFVAVAVGLLYYELHDPAPAPAPQAPLITTAPSPAGRPAGSGFAASKIGTTDAALDPTLHMQPMLITESEAYEGSGRNIFSSTAAPLEIPKPKAPARPLAPVAPPPVIATGPPPPPPIDLRFCGYFSSDPNGKREVILVHGDDVVLAHEGDIVLRRYRILTVSANSIQVEDMPNSNKQTLPLVAN